MTACLSPRSCLIEPLGAMALAIGWAGSSRYLFECRGQDVPLRNKGGTTEARPFVLY